MRRIRPIMKNCCNDNRSSIILRSISIIAALLLIFGYLFVIDEVSTIPAKKMRRITFLSNSKHIMNKSYEDVIHRMATHLRDEPSRVFEFKDDGRPIIHTFFNSLRSKKTNRVLRIDAAMIAVWKHAWSLAGWNPRVLGLEDAEKFPGFENMYEAVTAIHPKMSGDRYEIMCYLRYFAMAAVGGGYMSDYDVIPSYMPADVYGTLPNNGNFTSYSGHVPALLSGRGDEWERVARRLIEEGTKRQNDYRIFSDMMALREIVLKKEIKVVRPLPIIDSVLELERHEPISCDYIRNYRATHISHKFITHGGFNMHHRPVVMAEAVQTFHTACGGPDFFDTAKMELGLLR